MISIPPFALFYGAALLVPLCAGRMAGRVLLLAIPIVCGLSLWLLPAPDLSWSLLDLTLDLHRVDKLSLLFGTLFSIAATIAMIFALHVEDKVQHAASLVYVGSALGAVFAGDLLSFFLFWEAMAVSSSVFIFARRTRRAMQAGIRYLIYQVFSGVMLLAGVLIQVHGGGDLAFTNMELDGLGSWLIFLALGVKCAFPFLHNWLIDAYPEATPTGTVFLSAFTTKVAIYGLARAFAGEEILIIIGATMTCFPIFYAVIENDLRRVLAYSMVNQLGFMVCGIGIGTALAINGAVAHAFADVLFKGLLFMSMGSVLLRTGTINESELGGLYKRMPWTTVLCIVGAASISAFPLFSGFVSKSMVMSAALAEGHNGIWLALLFASAGVLYHAGIKIPYFAFFAHDAKLPATDPPNNMLAAMFLAALLCVGIGVFPSIFYRLLPYTLDYSPYDASHILAQLQLLFFSAWAYVWLNRAGFEPPGLRAVNLDVDWLYRKLAPRAVRAARATVGNIAKRCSAPLDALRLRCLGGIGAKAYVGYPALRVPIPALGPVVLIIITMLGMALVVVYI